jgi:sterol desaturase/sphingolipid hydroxylase (fatty acid hydroxylase superfamily)
MAALPFEASSSWGAGTMISDTVGFVVAVMCAFSMATLVEYFIHRLMHWGILYPEGHRWHHRSNEARSFLRDFLDYSTGAAVFCWLGFLVSTMSGFGWLLGAFAYAALASYSHQIQHANPNLVFWMRQPVHSLHHARNMTGHNFGILVDWWDRVFGTYRPIEWPRRRASGRYRLKHYLDIPWR